MSPTYVSFLLRLVLLHVPMMHSFQYPPHVFAFKSCLPSASSQSKITHDLTLQRSPNKNKRCRLDNSLKMIEEGNDLVIGIYESIDDFTYEKSNIEVEIFSDLAHISLDLATFLSPDTTILRFFVGKYIHVSSSRSSIVYHL